MKLIVEFFENFNEGLMKFLGFFLIKRNKVSVILILKISFYIFEIVFL